jgi:hypothetical protein
MLGCYILMGNISRIVFEFEAAFRFLRVTVQSQICIENYSVLTRGAMRVNCQIGLNGGAGNGYSCVILHQILSKHLNRLLPAAGNSIFFSRAIAPTENHDQKKLPLLDLRRASAGKREKSLQAEVMRSQLLHSLCVLSGKLLALVDDALRSLSQNNYRVHVAGREPENWVVHDGKFGVVGRHQHSSISQKLGSQQVQDCMPFAHKLDNGLILRFLNNLQIHQTTPSP